MRTTATSFKRLIFLLLVAGGAAYPVAAKPPGHPASSTAPRAFVPTAAPLVFAENRGQISDAAGNLRPDILFSARRGETGIYLTGQGIYYQFTRIIYPHGYDFSEQDPRSSEQRSALEKQIKTETHRFSLALVGANLHPVVRREARADVSESFYLAHCPNGITGVRSYSRLIYENVYPGIDWVVYCVGEGLKYDFVVQPGADPSQIRLKIEDADTTYLTEGGELIIKTSLGEIREAAPQSFAGGTPVASSFKRYSDGTIGFDVAAQPNQELRIDPVVAWATYFGGSSSETGSYNMPVVVDAVGHLYTSGRTQSTAGIATLGGFQTGSAGGWDAYVAKFTSAGTLLWATYYGGSEEEFSGSCALDPAGNIVVAGTTESPTGLASPGAFQTAGASGTVGDLFLAKFNNAGVRLWGTYYGGLGSEINGYCAVDPLGNIYLSGITNSTSGVTTPGSHQPLIGSTSTPDGLLVKFDGNGTRQWATYYGGNGNDQPISVTTDPIGSVYLSGYTASTNNIATPGTMQTTLSGGNDGFLAKFDGNGLRQWGTYYGGTGADVIWSAATASGAIYIVGYTSSAAVMSTTGSHQPALGGGNDLFLAKFNASGNRIWGSYYGGSGNEGAQSAHCSVVPNSGHLYLSSASNSTSAIASGGFQNSLAGGTDAILVKFDTTGVRQWGTYFGGPGNDYGYTSASDGGTGVYLVGYTNSGTGIATPGVHQTTLGGGSDAFLVRIGDVFILTDTNLAGSPYCAGDSLLVPFTIVGSTNAFTGANVFTAQLSNASGSFAAPTNIGTLAGTTAGTIQAVIPINVPAGTGYRIRVVGSNPTVIGSDNFDNLTINLPVVPTVNISVAPGNIICAGTPVTFTAVPVNGGSAPMYQWRKGMTLVGTNNATYTDNGLVNGDAISVVMISNAACASPAADTSNIVVMTVNPAFVPAVSIVATPNDTVCAGTPITFTATPTNGGTAPVYQWMKGTAVVGTNSPVYTDNAPATGDVVTVTMTNNAVCTNPTPVVSAGINVVINPATTPSVSIAAVPGNVVCAGTSVTLTATPVNGGTPTYQWTNNGVNIAGATGSTYTTASLLNGDQIAVTMTPSLPCSASTTITSAAVIFAVTAAPAQPGAISGPTLVCSASSVTYTVAPVLGATSYAWTLPTAWGGTSSIASIAAVAGNAGGTIAVTAVNACGTSAASTLAVSAVTGVPAQPTAVSGLAAPCTGTLQSYGTTAVAGANTYAWTIPAGWTGPASTTTTLSVTPGFGAASGNITVTASNICGVSAPATLPVMPVVAPSQPGAVTGPVVICQGTAGNYSIAPVSGATSYTWTLPAGWNGTSTTTSIAATPGTTGVVSVSATNACGTSVPGTLAVGVQTVPVSPSGVSGPSPVCANSTNTYAVAPSANASAYVWTLPVGWVGSSTTNSISATASVIAGSGSVAVAVTNACGTSAPVSMPVVVDAQTAVSLTISSSTGSSNVCPAVPVLFTAVASGGGATPTYTWTRSGSVQVGVTGATYTLNNPVNGDIIGLTMNSSVACASPATVTATPVTITVIPPVIPGINVNYQYMNASAICPGTQITFVANIVGGGPIPQYQWLRNGQPVGINSPTYSAGGWINGDTVRAVLTSSAQCATPAQQSSNAAILAVVPSAVPTAIVTSSAGTAFFSGQWVTFSASVTNAGPAPTFQWMRNGLFIPGATGPLYQTNQLMNGDTIALQLTSSDACAVPTVVVSNRLVMLATTSAVAELPAGQAGMYATLYPNPNDGRFTLNITGAQNNTRTSVDVVSAVGQVVFFREVISDKPNWSIPIECQNLAAGIYLLRLRSERGESVVMRFEVAHR